VGASAIQNIGAYGSEAKDFILYVDCVDLETGDIRHFCRAECEYGYRDSIFKNVVAGRYAVTHVHFQLSHSFRPNIEYGGIRKVLEEQGVQEWDLSPQVLRQTIIRLRQQKLPDPAVTGNAGSFFKNPVVSREKFEQLASSYPTIPHYDVSPSEVKIPAAWLIEQCGWKGRSQGRVAVHDRQPLVLVNLGGAKGEEVRQLALDIVNDIDNRFGIHLEPEVIFIG
jgi:UDP-N-acetylmuramate dehydrogenase